MTSQTRSTLKAEFEDGDTPDGTDYANLIDSFVSLLDSNTQTLNGRLVGTSFAGATVSASTHVVTPQVSATNGTIENLTSDGITTSAVSVTGHLSANSITEADKPYIEMYSTATAATTFTSAFVYQTLSAATSSAVVNGFSAHSTSLKMTYEGSAHGVFRAVGVGDFETDSAGKLDCAWAVNGSTKLQTTAFFATVASVPQTQTCQGLFLLSSGDEIELQHRTHTSAIADSTTRRFNLIISPERTVK